jgi:hypothetical protein
MVLRLVSQIGLAPAWHARIIMTMDDPGRVPFWVGLISK